MILRYTDAWVYQREGHFLPSLTVYQGKILAPEIPAERTLSLGGKFIFPLFEDAHNHPSGMAQSSTHLDLSHLNSLEALFFFLREKLSDYPQLLMGVRWNNTTEPLTANLLDQVAQDRCIIVVESSYHRAVLNSYALNRVAIPSTFPGNHGNGILEEQAWIEYAWPQFYESSQQIHQGLLAFQKHLLSQGIGAVHDLYVGTHAHLEAYRFLIQSKQWKLALVAYISPHLLHLDLSPFPFIQGVKLFLDGSLGCQSAALEEDYEQVTPPHRGKLWWSLDELKQRIRQTLAKELFAFALHVIGDRAIQQAFELISWARKEYGKLLQFRLEHLSLLTFSQLQQLQALDVAFCPQPNFIPLDQAYLPYLGKRGVALTPLAWFHQEKARCGFGSDNLPSDPWKGIFAAVHALEDSQRLDLPSAFHYYTLGSAELAQQAHVRGSLCPQKEANFWISSHNPFLQPSPPEQIFLKGELLEI